MTAKDNLISLTNIDTSGNVEIKSAVLADSVEVSDAARFAHDQVGPGKRVTLQFSLALENGHVVDSTLEAEPAAFVIGDGSLLPGFEQALFGSKAGDDIKVLLQPEQAFGVRLDENLQVLPRFRFPPDLLLSKGLMIDFADVGGYSQAGVISAFDANDVTVDFNHPLAGRAIVFYARICGVSLAD